MIVSLPMYDRPETAAANDRLWQTTRAHLGYGPEHLNRDDDIWTHWQSPDLLLSQTCGYPYRAKLHGKVRLVGTPVLDLPDCPPGRYHSVLVARQDDPRETPGDFADARFAYNQPLSQSGWAAPQNYAMSLGFTFAHPQQTGGHSASARAVADNNADIAALDALSWELMLRHDDFAQRLRVIAVTPSTPALPYITSLERDVDAVCSALAAAIADLAAEDRATLGIAGLTQIAADDYLAVQNPPPPAI